MARSVPADLEEDTLYEKRTPEQREALARLLKLAEEQGVKILTREDLDAMASVWPGDESVDEFLDAREKWRSEALYRVLP